MRFQTGPVILIMFKSSKLDFEGCYYLKNIVGMKNEVCMCNISMGRKICRLMIILIKIRLHNLINRKTKIIDLWLRSLEHNSFQTCLKLSES